MKQNENNVDVGLGPVTALRPHSLHVWRHLSQMNIWQRVRITSLQITQIISTRMNALWTVMRRLVNTSFYIITIIIMVITTQTLTNIKEKVVVLALMKIATVVL